jgi:hypothetical protein
MTYTAPAAPVTPQKWVHGNNGSAAITFASGTKTALNVEKGEFSYECENERIDHSGSAGWQVKQPGQQMINGSFTFIYDLANNPLIAPYGLTPGNVAGLELVLDAQNTANNIGTIAHGELWSGPALVKSFKPAGVGPQVGTQRVVVQWESSGPWTIPTV